MTKTEIMEMLKANTYVKQLSGSQITDVEAHVAETVAAGYDGLPVGAVLNYKGNNAILKASDTELNIVEIGTDAKINSGKIEGSYRTVKSAPATPAIKADSASKYLLVCYMTKKSI